jgi:acyl-CoA thioesterase II
MMGKREILMADEPLPTWDGRDVVDLLDVATVGPGRFRSRFAERNEHGRIYGGQMLGHAVAVAARTAPADRPASYLQFLFVAGGLPELAIDYEVLPLQDGKRFSSRNVRGSQPGGRIVCDASVSFAKPIEAPAHQAPPPADCGLDSDPERLPGLAGIDAPEAREVERTIDYSYRPHVAIDFRAPYVEDLLRPNVDQPRMRFWIKMRSPLADDPALHAAAFAYLSDYWINFAACIGHVRTMADADTRLYVASLNHAIWYHRALRADDWLLFDCVSPSGALGRGLSLGRIYDPAGRLVASAAQECLLAPVVPSERGT